MHIQFHGRELHSLCFVSENAATEENGNDGLIDNSSWIATGCEDGTVRLTRYAYFSGQLYMEKNDFPTLLVSSHLDNCDGGKEM